MRFRFARRPASTLLCLQFVALSSVAVSAPVTPAKSAVPAFCDTWSKLANIDETHAGIMLVKCPRPAAPDAWCGSVEQMPNPNAALRRIYLQRCLIRTRNVNAITDDSGEVEQSVPLGGALSPVQTLGTKSTQLYAALVGSSARRSVNQNLAETTGGDQPDMVAAGMLAQHAQDTATAATAQALKSQQVALAQQNVGNACRFQSSTVSFFAGLITLARAVKIIDNAKLGALLTPVAFSGCNKTVNATLAPITPIPPQTVAADAALADVPTITILESGYTDAFNVSPVKSAGVPQLITVGSVQDPSTKKPLNNKFTIIPICSAFPSGKKDPISQAIDITDALTQTTTVIVTVLPPAGACPAATGTGNK